MCPLLDSSNGIFTITTLEKSDYKFNCRIECPPPPKTSYLTTPSLSGSPPSFIRRKPKELCKGILFVFLSSFFSGHSLVYSLHTHIRTHTHNVGFIFIDFPRMEGVLFCSCPSELGTQNQSSIKQRGLSKQVKSAIRLQSRQ